MKLSKLKKLILTRILQSSICKSAVEDFEEQYCYLSNQKGKLIACLWYWFQIFCLVPTFLINSIYWSYIMFVNYLKIAFRNIKKHKGFSFINVAGLAIGMACSIFIFMYVLDDLSYDKFHKKARQIHRLVEVEKYSSPIKQGLLGPILQRELLEVINYTRIYANKVWGRNTLVGYKDNHFFSDGFFLVDPSFFGIFSFPFIKGDSKTALSDLKNVVLTNKMAKKMFGDEDPMGKVITRDNDMEFVVTGVLEDIPHNSHMFFDFLIPIENYKIIRNSPTGMSTWGNSAFLTYLLVQKDVNKEELDKKIADVIAIKGPQNRTIKIKLQALADIHLRSHFLDELEINSDIRYVYIFSAIALLIMLVAGMNYMNLSTACSLNRAREVGMRKVVGAKRKQLILQFLGEAIFMSVFALIIAILLVTIFIPMFNNLSGKEIQFNPISNLATILALFLLSLFIGVLAGSFPAFFLSAFHPIYVITGKIKSKKDTTSLIRKSLVVSQFAISIGLIICTGIIKDQMNYIRNINMGFNKEQVVVFPTNRNPEAIKNVNTVMESFKTNPNVLNVASSSQTPGIRPFYRVLQFIPEDKEREFSIANLWTNQEFVKTYQLEFVAGRDFSKERSTDATSSFILNETAVTMGGWCSPENAIGQQVRCDNKNGEIIGVVKDFHFLSLHNAIEPMIMHYDESRFYSISARMNTDNISSTLSSLKSDWKKILPNVPCNYFFVDDYYDRQYRADQKVGSFLQTFTFLAIFISCLGLFGLASFSAEQRTKEVGIRKVLGASVTGIFTMLSKDFTKLVLLANLISWPLAYWVMNSWLQNFAYKTNIGFLTFIFSAILALAIALLTVSYQSIKAAIANPVDSLKYE